jgi:hypothetical protein
MDSARLNMLTRIKESVQRIDLNRQRRPNAFTHIHFGLRFRSEMHQPGQRASDRASLLSAPVPADRGTLPHFSTVPLDRRAPPAQTLSMEMDAAATACASTVLASSTTTDQLV